MFPFQEPFRPPAGGDQSPLERAVKHFEHAWRQGPRPRIEDYLPADGELRYRLLIELVHTDLELRLKAGEAARTEEYLARYPELASNTDAAVELIAAEYELRRRGESHLSLGDFLQRFPQYRAELPERIAGPTIAGRDTLHPRFGPPSVSPPEVTGYEVLGSLGHGGMGLVYKARQQSLHRLVALKFLPEQCARDPLWLARFRREARTASALNHPHICTIYDTGDCAGRPYLSMELIEGRTLEALLGQRPAVEDVALWIAQAARALTAAHAAGVVHRDIKPANLMVRNDGIVKVLDFGLARRLPTPVDAEPGASSHGTDPGTRVGTLLYMSPEQAQAEPVGTAGDIFSLGLVLYEMVTGQHPFLADSEVGVLHAIVVQEPIPAARLNPEVSAPLDALLRGMLAKDPCLRPTAAEVDTVLTELAESRGDRHENPPPRPPRSPTVGRGHERAALHAGFESAVAGHGWLLCVTGEPGLGKTTLVEDFLAELATDGRPHSVARGRCSERLAGAEAYLPVLEALDNLVLGQAGAAAAQALRRLAPSWYSQMVPLGTGERHVASAQPSSQERLKREMLALLTEVSRLRPLVFFLDDVHWADASTVDLLAYLGGRCAGLRLLILLTYRPTEMLLGQHPFVSVQLELQRHGVCREVPLSFLSRAEVDSYLGLAFPGHGFAPEFADLLHAKTEGNPLFLVDLLRYLRDRGVIAEGLTGWNLAQAVPDFQRELPASVRSLIQKKLAQLGEADRRLLAAVSVQGYEFDSAVAARVLGLDVIEVEERLEVLDRVHGLVRLRREQQFPDGTLTIRYRFVHALYQNALYALLRPTRKAAFSAAAAQALLDCYGKQDTPVAGELALLFEAARDFPRAVDYFLRAAEHAVRMNANQEAIVLARRGLALLQELPDTPARVQQELALLIALGVSLVATSGFASTAVEQTYDRAQALCQRTEDIPTLFPVLYGLWNMYLVRCELPRCKELATQIVTLAQGQPDPVFLLVAHNVLQQPLFHLGDLAAARRHQEQGLELYDPDKHRTLTAVYGEDPGVGCLMYGALTLWDMGYPEQALRSAQAARNLAEELSSPFNQAQALYFGAYTHLCRREVGRAQELARSLMEISRDEGFALLFEGGKILEGWSLTVQGQMEEGIRQMWEGLARWQATGALSHRPCQLALLADALARAGRDQEGLTALAEGLALANATGERFCEAELYRLQGEIAIRRAEVDPLAQQTAEGCFRQALDVARRQQAKSLELRATMGLSRLYRQQGRLAEARPLLAETYDWFTEGFDTRDLREAKALLES